MSEKFIYFTEITILDKTKIFGVVSASNDRVLGLIKWHAQWRKYAFYPYPDTLYDHTCLNVISEKMESLMAERGKKKKL